jgi:hypothetical protein
MDPIEGSVVVHCVLPSLKLLPGHYSLKLILEDGYSAVDILDDVPAFEIRPTDYWGSGQLPTPVTQGFFLQDAEWTVRSL